MILHRDVSFWLRSGCDVNKELIKICRFSENYDIKNVKELSENGILDGDRWPRK